MKIPGMIILYKEVGNFELDKPIEIPLKVGETLNFGSAVL